MFHGSVKRNLLLLFYVLSAGFPESMPSVYVQSAYGKHLISYDMFALVPFCFGIIDFMSR